MDIQNDTIQNLIELTNKKVKSIREEGASTIIEFEDGEILPLFGGGALITEQIKLPECSFCGREQSKGFPLMGPPGKDDPMICSVCAAKAVEIFIKHGVEVELDISHFPQSSLKKKRWNLNSILI